MRPLKRLTPAIFAGFSAARRPTPWPQKTYPRRLWGTLWIRMFTSRQSGANAGFEGAARELTSSRRAVPRRSMKIPNLLLIQ